MDWSQKRVRNLLPWWTRIYLLHVDVIVIILITVTINGLILDSFLVQGLFFVIIVLSTWAILLLRALLLVVKRILAIQIHKIASTIIWFHHWILLVLASWHILIVIVVTSPCCVIVTCLAEWIFVWYVEITTFLPFLIYLRSNLLSLINKLRW